MVSLSLSERPFTPQCLLPKSPKALSLIYTRQRFIAAVPTRVNWEVGVLAENDDAIAATRMIPQCLHRRGVSRYNPPPTGQAYVLYTG